MGKTSVVVALLQHASHDDERCFFFHPPPLSLRRVCNNSDPASCAHFVHFGQLTFTCCEKEKAGPVIMIKSLKYFCVGICILIFALKTPNFKHFIHLNSKRKYTTHIEHEGQ